jgi:hypothetical protein
MRYHAPTNQFTVSASDLQSAVDSLTYAMRHIRKLAGLPLDKYNQDGPLSDADHAQRGIIDAANRLGIDLGADWGSDLDLRDSADIPANAFPQQEPTTNQQKENP